MVGFIGGAAGGAAVNIVINGVDKFSGTFGKASSSLGKLGSVASTALVGLATAGAAAGVAIGALGVSALKGAIDLEETSSKFATVFQDVEADADAVAKNLQENFGLSGRAAKTLLADTGDLLTGFNFTGAAALDVSKQVNELAVDLASFSNASGGAEAVSKALTKALLGERESLKTYGIAILDADVNQRVFENGASELTGTALRQAKATATLQLAMEQSKNAIGDFERTQDSAANRMRILQASFTDLKDELGTAMIPAFQELLTVIGDDLMPILEPLVPILSEVLVRGIQLISAGFQKISSLLSGDGAGFGVLMEFIKPVIEQLKEIGNNLFTKIQEVWTKLVATFQENKEPIMAIFTSLRNIVGNLFEILGTVLGVVFDLFGYLIDIGVVDAAIVLFQGLFNVLDNIVGVLSSIFKWVVKIITKLANSKFGKTISGLLSSAVSLGSKISSGLAGDTAQDFISRPGGTLQKFSPNDTIIGMKNPENLGGGGITVNIDKVQGADPTDMAIALQKQLSSMISV